MRILMEGDKKILSLMRKRRFYDTEYRLMKYVLRVDTESGSWLLNTVTGQLISLSLEEAARLAELPSKKADWMMPLLDASFLVPVYEDEKKDVDGFRNALRCVKKKTSIDHYVILTTTDCNARCFYCFENGLERVDMSSETAERLTDYIVERCEGKPVSLKWFGGEPLVGVRRIDQLCAGLKERNICYQSIMVTNGYLFDEPMMDRAVKDWHLRQVQITLDGTERIYNRIKAYVGVSGSPYQRVMGNIRGLLDRQIRVAVRLNLDRYNSEDLTALSEELFHRFGARENLYVYARVIFRDDRTGKAREAKEEKRLYLLEEKLNRWLTELGIRATDKRLPMLQECCCSAENLGNRVIDPQGNVFLCDSIRDAERIGNIWSDVEDAEAIRRSLELAVLPQCGDCPLYPGCSRLNCCLGRYCINETTCAGKLNKAKENLAYWVRKKAKEDNEDGRMDL